MSAIEPVHAAWNALGLVTVIAAVAVSAHENAVGIAPCGTRSPPIPTG
ncbi:hypothetical protein OG824_08500 [Streptomyces prunicolor]|nr:hypothetical protein [Streptomyces prunicolor]MCX5235261.1 hypothetical protein [Streptomyces prunicolor]